MSSWLLVLTELVKQRLLENSPNQFKSKERFRVNLVLPLNQLQVWADRVDIPIIMQSMGSDPASVAFDIFLSC